MIVEIEVDTLEQLDEVLAVGPDLVLLDNMSPAALREAVARRDARCAAVELEASGGIDLGTVRAVAETGVERISVGALTHAAVSLDFGLDWQDQGAGGRSREIHIESCLLSRPQIGAEAEIQATLRAADTIRLHRLFRTGDM